jgi:trans-aconitate methyltransferase
MANLRPDLGPLVESYRDSLRVHGDTPAAVQWPKGRQSLRWQALTGHIAPGTRASFLDFGCGLGHFEAFLAERFPGSQYHGVDVVPEFIEQCRARGSAGRFRQIASAEEVTGEYDHVVLSGVFNKACFADPAQHAAYVQQVLKHLFARARRTLSVDFMSDHVDFIQSGAYHQNVAAIRDFARRELSPRLRIDETYLPYEFCLIVYRDAAVVRPDNVYPE